jgi:hypothetical protein
MAEIVEVEFDLASLQEGGLDLEYRAPLLVHDKDLHATSILYDLDAKLNRTKRKTDAEHTEDELRILNRYRFAGHMWEMVLRELTKRTPLPDLPKRNVIEQEPIKLDHINLTPDGLDIGYPEWVLEEYKCTWKSADRLANLEEDFWLWLAQIKAYCYALKCRRARLFVMLMCGNWKPPVPDWRRLDMRFSQRELDLNWSMMLKHRDRMLAA